MPNLFCFFENVALKNGFLFVFFFTFKRIIHVAVEENRFFLFSLLKWFSFLGNYFLQIQKCRYCAIAFSSLQRSKIGLFWLFFCIFSTTIHVVAEENPNAAPLSRLRSSFKFFTIVRPSSVRRPFSRHQNFSRAKDKNHKKKSRTQKRTDVRNLERQKRHTQTRTASKSQTNTPNAWVRKKL